MKLNKRIRQLLAGAHVVMASSIGLSEQEARNILESIKVRSDKIKSDKPSEFPPSVINSNLNNTYQMPTTEDEAKNYLYDMMGLKEVKIGDEVIGFSEDFGNIAVLKKKELIGMENWLKYDQRVHQLEKQGYRVLYSPAEKPKEVSRKNMYDILE